MKIEFMLREPGNHHMISRPIVVDCVPSVGDSVLLSDDGDVYKVHSLHWYLYGRSPSVIVMLDP